MRLDKHAGQVSRAQDVLNVRFVDEGNIFMPQAAGCANAGQLQCCCTGHIVNLC